jgi:nicotinate phosphoribosyltransferase
MGFLIVDEEDIKAGKTTDKYFVRLEEILEKKGINPLVVAELTVSSGWGVFCGLEDVLTLFDGKAVDIYAMSEGTIFFPHEPVITIVGNYLEFATLETAILGFISSSSGIATKAFKVKLAARDRPVYSFGSRRQHPVLAAMVERSAYIGGMDGVSNVAAEKYLGLDSIGTMPHSLMICMDGNLEGWKAFNEVMPSDVPRIYLIDTYEDEKTEAIKLVENLDRIDAVRLDTPSSRRGNFRKIIQEVRWELDIRGKRDVKIFVSGGIDERAVLELSDIVDAFGVGTSVAGAPPIDFAFDIVEKEGKFVAKRGKRGGMKQVFRDMDSFEDQITLFKEAGNGKPLLEKWMENGRILQRPSMEKAREWSLEQMRRIKELGIESQFL